MPPAALAIWLLCVGVDAGAGAAADDAGDGGMAGGDAGIAAAPPAPRPRISPPAASPSMDAGAVPVAPAPLVSLEGTVLEKGTRHRLAGASVTIDAVSSGETDESGSFIASLSPGRHTVEIQLPGYDLVREAVDVAPPATRRSWRLLRRLEDRRYQTVVSPPGQPPKIALS